MRRQAPERGRLLTVTSRQTSSRHRASLRRSTPHSTWTFVDPAYAPGTGTPEIGGFTSREAQEFVRGLAIVGCDMVEVYPAYDHAQITALLAANVAHEFLSLLAFSKKSGSM
jgi:Arginase family